MILGWVRGVVGGERKSGREGRGREGGREKGAQEILSSGF